MRLSESGLRGYVADVAELIERYGIVLDALDDDVVIEAAADGSRSFEVRGSLSDARQEPRSVAAIGEIWRPVGGDQYERWEYRYELLDHDRDHRRAFHLHHRDFFIHRFAVVVHEHCERPIGRAPCPHLAGPPVRDAFQGVERLLDAWVDPNPPDCRSLPCLE